MERLWEMKVGRQGSSAQMIFLDLNTVIENFFKWSSLIELLLTPLWSIADIIFFNLKENEN